MLLISVGCKFYLSHRLLLCFHSLAYHKMLGPLLLHSDLRWSAPIGFASRRLTWYRLQKPDRIVIEWRVLRVLLVRQTVMQV